MCADIDIDIWKAAQGKVREESFNIIRLLIAVSFFFPSSDVSAFTGVLLAYYAASGSGSIGVSESLLTCALYSVLYIAI